MPGATTRLSLYKPGGGSSGAYGADEVADIDRINENMDKLDDAVGGKIITSTTRPASPYDGQIIKETDTGRAMVWRAGITTWVELAPGGIPVGNTALRDLLWPTPATAPARVALSNTVPRFFNTDKGYEQQYFAQFDDAGVGTAPARETHGWGPARSGALHLLDRYTVSSAGGTVTKKGALITFSGTNTVNIDGVLTSDFDDYLVQVDIDSASADFTGRLRFRNGGVTDVSASYVWSYHGVTGGGAFDGGGNGGGDVNGISIGRATSVGGSRMELLIAQAKSTTRRTLVMGQSFDSANFASQRHGGYTAMGAKDGFDINTGGATTMAGRIRVFGYAI